MNICFQNQLYVIKFSYKASLFDLHKLKIKLKELFVHKSWRNSLFELSKHIAEKF